MTFMTNFFYPLSPILAMVGGGTLLVILECLPSSGTKALKNGLALLGATASIALTFYVWKTWPTGYTTAGLEGAKWLVEFTKNYRVDTITLGLFAAIGLFTFLSVVFLSAQFSESDVLSEILALTLFIGSGMMVLVSADSLLLIFLGLELLSLPTYVLVGMRRRDRNSCEAALKYFLFGSFATVLLVFGIALLYAQFGTLHIPKMATKVAELASVPGSDWKLTLAGMTLILIAVGFKVGLVPFHMWLPDAYQGAPTAVTGFMGSAVKLAGFGFAVRILWGIFLPMASAWSNELCWLAVATMFVGNLAALAQDNLKRMFAYSSISHAGFLMLGVAVLPKTGPNPSALYYYLVVYGLMFVGLFACLAVIEKQTRNTDIFSLSGMGFTHPTLALCIAIFAVSAAGIPPTAGFFGKYFIFLETVHAEKTLLVVLALIASLMGVYYYLRVVVYLYMKESKETLRLGLAKTPLTFACILVCALALLYFAVAPGALTLTQGLAR